MRWGDIISLISCSYTVNSVGDSVETQTSNEVYSNQKSVRQNEFYQSLATGLKAELMFEIRAIDYNGETKLNYNGDEYNIIRAYNKNGEIIELVCTSLVAGG